MPLRATLDTQSIQSFNLNHDEWINLKATYKNQSLLMPCCETRAVPKTSKLGTQYFAHLKRGDCSVSQETKEHLYLKSLIANIAQEYGWIVTTEHVGQAKDGEKWIADVFCQKGDLKLAFEVQWSHQTNGEYLRRTEKYTNSGVRCAWLFRLNGRKSISDSNYIEAERLPYFGFRHKDGHFNIARYETPVDEFIRGMLTRKLAWLPKPNQQMLAHICYIEETCWKCRQFTNVVTSVVLHDTNGQPISYLNFTDEPVARWVANHIPKQTLSSHGIGEIKERYSKTQGGAYLSNGCIHCDALQGNFFQLKYYDEEESYLVMDWTYSPVDLPVKGRWFFNGRAGLSFY